MGMQGIDEYKVMLPVALDNGVSPVEAKEVLYQAVDYLGLGRVFPFFKATNDVLAARGVEMPLPDQATTAWINRLEKGEETQIRLFGPQMKEFSKKGTINKWLVDNCFGDYYTRKGLDDKDREMDQVFDWVKDNHMPIRDAIWDHEMEANGHDTMKTEKAVEWILKASDDEVKDYCEKNLEK